MDISDYTDSRASDTGEDKHPVTSTLAIQICFTVGLTLTALAFFNYSAADKERLQERLLRGTQTLAALSSVTGPAPSFGEIAQTLLTMQQKILSGSEPDLAFLQNHAITPEPPSQERINLRYVPRVELNRSSNIFEMRDFRGNIKEFPYPIQDAEPAGVQAADRSGEYFPILLQASTGIDKGIQVQGLNHFHDPQFHLVMDQARDSGLITSRTSFPLLSESEPFIISHSYIALYTPGPPPQTISERRARHTGFLSAVSYIPGAGVIEFLPDSYLGLEAAFIMKSSAFSADQHDPELKKILSSADFQQEQFAAGDNTILIFARPSYSLRTRMLSATRWWALSIGLLLTAWICSQQYLSRTRSNKLSLLVAKRTADLAERSRKLSEVNQALTESESRYRMLADNVSDVIFTQNLQGICTYISPSITQQNGFSAEDYLGKPIYTHLTQASAIAVKRLLQNAGTLLASDLPLPATHTFESETYCKDGSLKSIETTISLLNDKQGNPIEFLGVSRDITDRKKNEKEKVSLEAAFQQSQKMEAIGTLAGGVAHDFNNLLTGILGHAELLKDVSSSPEDIAHSVGIIESAAIRARELTSQLLGFARKGHYQSVPVNINSVLNETIALLKRTIDKNINITCKSCEWQLLVSGDPGQISQVILNLAVNARDAMPHGGTLSFKLSLAEIDEYFSSDQHEKLLPGTYCEISVADTGVGIAKEDVGRIFEPFFTNKPKGKGTGLGLAMVYGVTKNHGGLVTVYSEPGSGSIFTVYLPLLERIKSVEAKPETKTLLTGNQKVLVIDDDDIVRDLADMVLRKLGYSPHFAEDGEKGVAFYEAHHSELDLVIVDLNMPNMGGLECIKKLVDINPRIKVILSTGYSQDSLGLELDRKNICGFLQKPFMLHDLSEMMVQCLKN